MKSKTILVLAISFAFILGTMIAGSEGAFAAKDDAKKTEKKEKKEKKVIILYKSDETDKKDEKGKKHKDKEKHVEKLKEKNAKIKYVYDIIPGIAATIDEDSIIDLMNDEDVLAVVDDVEVYAHLQFSIPQINADDVHAAGITGAGVNVCIVDTGVDDSHPALNSVIAEYDFINNDSDATDDHYHGTHVAGIVASIDSTYKGVAPGASLMAAKVLGSTGSGTISSVIQGIDWCVANGADIITMSLGYGLFTGTCDTLDAIASNNAVAAGVVVIASSGNNGSTNGMGSPSCGSDVISVGAVSQTDVRAGFSNGSTELDVVAPGVSIQSLNIGGSGYRTLSGTSMAAPHVAGTAALLLESNSELTPAEIRTILRDSSVDLPLPPATPGFDNLYGHGRIDAQAAVNMDFEDPPILPTQNLFVSAENSQFDNYMAGAMVIEVVVIDPDISDTNEGKGEPDVTVQGKSLRMVQAIDGNWYGYFANRQSANAADATQLSDSGSGLDFGVGCTAVSATDVAGITLTETKGVYFPRALTGVTHTPGVLADCSTASGTGNLLMHVVRESKTINPYTHPDVGPGNGQISLADNMWPFIQLVDLNPTGNVVINYNKGGGTQSTTLTFDTVDQFANLELDRTVFTRGAQVHLTMTDLQLNIDPTDEDSWSWGTNPASNTAFYQLFDENGNADADGTSAAVNLIPVMGTDEFMFEDNGILLINLDAQNIGTEILRIIDNDDSQTDGAVNIDASTVSTDGDSITTGNQPITFTELMPNSGIFSNTDESDVSNLAINAFAPRGRSATVDYNETPITVLVSFVPSLALPLNIGDVSVDEDAGFVSIPITWDPSDPAFAGLTKFTFALIPFDGTAVAGSDYTAQNIIITDANPVTGVYRVDIQIIDDTTIESDETFTVFLTDPNAEVAIIDTSTVTINDNDSPPPTEEFFKLSKNSDFSTDDREFETSDTIHILVFSPDVDIDNMKKAEFKIEDSERNRLKGTLDFNPDGIFTSSVSLADLIPGTVKVELKLEDNDRKKFNVKENIIISEPPSPITLPLNIGDASVNEDVDIGYVEIPITWDPSDPAFVGLTSITFALKTSDGTAIEGDDYQPINYVIITNPASGISKIAAHIIDDTIFESDETFTITLTDPNADGATIGISTVTINDNDPQPLPAEFFKLSKNSDFSTEDREFETSDILYMLTTSNLVDYSNMKKAEFKIQDSKKVKLQGKLILGADGIFTSSVSLADLNPGTAKVELKLEDKNRNKFNVKENITIS